MRAPLAALGLLAVALAFAAPASAQLVFDRGNDIWGANDDGSNPHLLVQAAPLGMDQGLGSPAVAPDGEALLFRGTTFRNTYAGHSQDFYGENTDGTYALQGGTVRRLSAPPVGSPMAWSTGDIVPEPAPGGAYVYEHGTCTEVSVLFDYSFFWNPFCKNELRSSSLAAGAAGSAPFATPCDGDAEGGPADPSPDPASGSLLVAYVGCTIEEGGVISPPALIVSGPGEAGAKAVAYGAEYAYPGGEALADPSWSPDGSRLVLYDHGGTNFEGPADTAGIYVLEPMPNPATSRLLIKAPEVEAEAFETLASPRFAGPGTIVFVAGGSVWSVPASCDECTFPGDATKLFAGGSDPSTQAFSVAWTAREVAPASVYPGQAGEPGGSGSAAGGQSGASPSSSAPRPAAHDHKGRGGRGGTLALALGAVHAPPLRKLLAKGLPVKARCSRACGLTLSLAVDAKTARRYRLLRQGRSRPRSALLRRHGAAVVVGRARLELRGGKLTGARVRFTHRARRALRRARGLKLRLSAAAHAAGVAPAGATRIVKVHR